jgi:hypothetical protein
VIITGAADTPQPAPTPELLAQLQAEIDMAHKDGIRAKSAVKRQADHVAAAKALLQQLGRQGP